MDHRNGYYMGDNHSSPHSDVVHDRSPPRGGKSHGYPPLQMSIDPQPHDPQERTARPMHMQQSFPPDDKRNVHLHQPQLSSSTPGLSRGLSRPLTELEQERLVQLDRLKYFLATAPSRWDEPEESSAAGSSSAAPPPGHPSSMHPALNRFPLPSSEYVTCVLWSGLYHITGTDIVRALVFRFEAFGRPVRNMKKFEEGVFSDLRNLKPGVDACLEEPKSPFLDLLFKYQCIRTQKKQKVFYWFSVPHDRLFLDALERDLKREKMGMESTTVITGEPAMSFSYDSKRSLYEQFRSGKDGEGELEAVIRRADAARASNPAAALEATNEEVAMVMPERSGSSLSSHSSASAHSHDDGASSSDPNSPFFSMFSLFEGSPMYKQRRKKPGKPPGPLVSHTSSEAALTAPRSNATRTSRSYTITPHNKNSPPMDEYDEEPRGRYDGAVPDRRRTVEDEYYAQAHSDQEYGLPQRSRSHHESQRANYPYPQQSYIPPIDDEGSLVKDKAFVCPLFSCGRLFKRMEHLKRHLRTHTLERPYPCSRCKKRFSRSDNLNQHLRTHLRADQDNGAMEDDSMSEDEGMDIAAYAQCEIEVQGGIRDVPGDEEGLVTAGNPQQLYYQQAQQQAQQQQHQQQWTTPSPSFSSGSAPSPDYVTQSQHAAQPPYTEDYVTSISAPSHKQMFDHASLYPPGSEGGAVRRHRSMTPSLGIPARRPNSAAASEFPHHRGYHPYASTSTHSSPSGYSVPLGEGRAEYHGRTSSVDEYAARPASSYSGRTSLDSYRSASRPRPVQLENQMRHMLTMDEPPYSSNSQSMYRTDSPAPYEGGGGGGGYEGGKSGAQWYGDDGYYHPSVTTM